MAVFNKCCGCLPLQTGTIIIGIFNLICTIYHLFASPGKDAGDFIGVAISVCVVGLLIYGAVQRKRFFLVPWLICVIIGLILLVIAFVVLLFLPSILEGFIQEKDRANAKAIIAGIIVIVEISIVITIALFVFFILVVHSFFVELKEEDEGYGGRNRPVQKGLYPTPPA